MWAWELTCLVKYLITIHFFLKPSNEACNDGWTCEGDDVTNIWSNKHVAKPNKQIGHGEC